MFVCFGMGHACCQLLKKEKEKNTTLAHPLTTHAKNAPEAPNVRRGPIIAARCDHLGGAEAGGAAKVRERLARGEGRAEAEVAELGLAKLVLGCLVVCVYVCLWTVGALLPPLRICFSPSVNRVVFRMCVYTHTYK